MQNRKLWLLATSMIVGLSVSSIAVAQTAQPAPSAQTQSDDEDEDATEVEEVVVTGSRIRRSEFTSAAPVQIITSEQASLEGLVDTSELLQQSTVASGSFQTNNQLTGFVVDGGPGANSISLRGLGAQRTLVLLNGRRAGPAGTRGQVGAFDLNVMPQSLIQRVEILKDGASSIYGSDAIAGVVNIITKSNFDGIELNVFRNQSFEGGGEQTRLSAGWGKTFDRGYMNAGVDWYKQDPLQRGDRDDTACAADYLFNPTTGAQVDYNDASTGGIKCYGLFANVLRTGAGDLIYEKPGINYAVAGNNSPIAGMARQGRAGFPGTFPYGNYNEPQFARGTILSPVERTTLAFNAGFDLTPATEVYVEALVNRRESEQWGSRQFFPSVSIANAGNVGTGSAPFTAAQVGSLLPIIPLKSDNWQTVDYARLVAGVRGTFSGLGFLDGWDWDLYAQMSRSEGEYSNDIIYNDRVLAVTGAGACNQALITVSGSLPGGQCSTLPGGAIPWTSSRVLSGAFTDAEKAFLFTTETGNTVYEHKYVEGSIAGDLFELPAGPLGAALGFQLREESIDDTPGFNARNSNLWGSTSAGRTTGSDEVREAFAEFEVPLLKGLSLAENLTASLSGRWSDYESYGESKTYKIGLNWQIVPAWRVRATKGTSFRAPALYELYLANQSSFLGQTAVDPCILYENSSDPILQQNCAAAGVPTGYTAGGTSSATIFTGGGLGVLEAETAEAKTLGVIWTPEFIDLSVALDYFEIEVDDEVRTFGAANIVSQCYRSGTFPNNPFCTLFQRNGPAAPSRPNEIITIQNSYVNVANQINRGLDLTVRYEHEFSFGDLTIDGQFTWQLEDEVTLLGGGAVEDDNGETTEPDFTGQLNTRFDRGDWTFFWGVDLFGKTSDTEAFGTDIFNSTRYSSTCRRTVSGVVVFQGACTDPTIYSSATRTFTVGGIAVVGQPTYYKQYAEFTAYHDFSVRRRFDDWTVQVGIQNAFDERPPSQSSGQFRVGTAALNLYDVVGRRAFVSVSKTW